VAAAPWLVAAGRGTYFRGSDSPQKDFAMPEFHYWTSGAAIYGLVSFILPLIIAFVGVHSMMPRYQVQLLVALSVAVVFFGSFLAATQEKKSAEAENNNSEMRQQIQLIAVALGLKTDATADQTITAAQTLAANIANELKGTKSVCYWYANLDAPRDADGGFVREMVNTGSVIGLLLWYVYPAGVSQYSDEYNNSPYRNLSGHQTCWTPGFGLSPPTIKPGKYGIDFTGSNDSGWHELLTITETEKEITEEMVITKDGKGEILKNSWRKLK
jgi:hypothetical protein